jgi:HJR/Mrr/RecB family endonuclease
VAGITLAQAEAQLALYLAAEAKVLTGQSYEIAGRKLTRANLEEIRNGVEIWNSRVVTLAATSQGRGRARTIVPAG